MPFKKNLDKNIWAKSDEISKADLSRFMLDLFLGETCNLHCKHCYFGEQKPISSLLNYKQWVAIINDFLDYGCRHFHISGKESLLTPHTSDIMEYLNMSKEKYRDIFWGIITNGTSLRFDQYNKILDSHINYMEISLDGHECIHDYIRGIGTYNKVINTLSKLHNLSKINISYTINKLNSKDLKKVLRHLYDLGIRKFYCSPMQIKGMAIRNNIPLITSNHYIEVIEDIKEYVYNNFQNTNIRFSIPHTCVEYMLKVELYSNDILEYFKTGKPIYWNINSNIIELSLHTISIPLFTQASITSDGHILPSSDRVEERCSLGIYDGISGFMKARKTSILKYFSTDERI